MKIKLFNFMIHQIYFYDLKQDFNNLSPKYRLYIISKLLETSLEKQAKYKNVFLSGIIKITYKLLTFHQLFSLFHFKPMQI